MKGHYHKKEERWLKEVMVEQWPKPDWLRLTAQRRETEQEERVEGRLTWGRRLRCKEEKQD